MLRDHKVKIKRTENPSNINFENLEYTRIQKFFRWIFSLIFSTILIGASFLITAIIYSLTNTKSYDCPTEPIDPSASNIETEELRCYCNTLSLNIRFTGNNAQYCSQFRTEYLKKLGMIFFLTSLNLFLNMFIRICLKCVSYFQKYHTLIERFDSLLKKIYLPIFINTALITPLLYSNIYGFSPGLTLMSIFNKNSNKSDIFPDFTLSWFLKVAVSISTTIFINTFSPLTALLKDHLRFAYKKRKAQNSKSNKLRRKLLHPPEFPFCYRYAYCLMTVNMALFFEPLLPYSIMLCAVQLWISYFCNRKIFSNFTEKPAQFGSDLTRTALFITTIFTVVNSLVKIYAYGAEGTMPEELKFTSEIFNGFFEFFGFSCDGDGSQDDRFANEVKRRVCLNLGVSAFAGSQILVLSIFWIFKFLREKFCLGNGKTLAKG